MKDFRILVIAEHRLCISTLLHCTQLCIYIVYVQGADKNIFGHEIKLLTILLCGDSIFTIQDFAFSKND